MSLPRTFAVVLVASALLIVVASPAAQARTFQKAPPTVGALAGGWTEAAVTWLGRFVGVQPHQVGVEKLGIPIPPLPVWPFQGGGYIPMTGSCIDPNGCHFGG